MIIFGSVPYFREPRRVLGGAAWIDAYVPVLIVFSLAMLSLGAMPGVLAATGSLASCAACKPRRPARSGYSAPS